MTQVPASGACCLPQKWAKKMENYTQHQKLAGVWHCSVLKVWEKTLAWRKRRQNCEVQSQEHSNTKKPSKFYFHIGCDLGICWRENHQVLAVFRALSQLDLNVYHKTDAYLGRCYQSKGYCFASCLQAPSWAWSLSLCLSKAPASDHSHQNSSWAVNHSPGEQGRFFSSLLVLQAWIRLI